MRINPVTAVIALWMSIFVACLLMFPGLSGCAGKGQLNPTTGAYDSNATASIIVVSAENFRESALNIFEALMEFEKNNDAVLRKMNPSIHEFAEKVRRESKGWLDELSAAKTAYQKARTPENESRLKSAVALIDSMMASASKHLAQATTTKAP